MGRKKRFEAYDRNSLAYMSSYLRKLRSTFAADDLPPLQINLDALEKTIHELPKKDREVLEKFWGLIPGTPNHSLKIINPKYKNDIAFKNMIRSALLILYHMFSFDCLYRFEENSTKIINELLVKINKTGAENVSDIDAVKYLLIFLIFFVNGPRMIFDEEGHVISLEKEDNVHFDEFSLLYSVWIGSGKKLKDHSINLKLLIDAIYMFDIKDIITMKRLVRLPISKEFDDIETETLASFTSIRHFKEKLFQYGSWSVTSSLIYGNNIPRKKLNALSKNFQSFCQDWNNIEKFKTSTIPLEISDRTLTLSCYEIGGLQFTDIYEVMFLYVARNLI